MTGISYYTQFGKCIRFKSKNWDYLKEDLKVSKEYN